MNRDEIIRLYEKANGWSPAAYANTVEELERFAALVAAAEREAIRDAIGQIVIVPTLSHGILVRLLDVDDAIRARGEQK